MSYYGQFMEVAKNTSRNVVEILRTKILVQFLQYGKLIDSLKALVKRNSDLYG